jgi:hypothetical protein
MNYEVIGAANNYYSWQLKLNPPLGGRRVYATYSFNIQM